MIEKDDEERNDVCNTQCSYQKTKTADARGKLANAPRVRRDTKPNPRPAVSNFAQVT